MERDGRTSEHDIPWTLVEVREDDQAVLLRYPTLIAPGVDVAVKAAVEMGEQDVSITLTERVRTEGSSGLVGVYFDTCETTVVLDDPLEGRVIRLGHVDAGMDAYREVLRSADREAAQGR